jgi:hypothetical protein
MIHPDTHISLVVDHCTQQVKGMGFPWFLICPVAFNHFSNGTNSHLSGKTKLFPDIVVAQLMDFDLAMGFMFKGNLTDVITSLIESNQGFFQNLMLPIGRNELDFCYDWHVFTSLSPG